MPRISSLKPTFQPISERTESPLKMTREQFERSCMRQGSAASRTAPDRTGELLAIASNKQLARHISKEVRTAYKAGSGSSNKAYIARKNFSSEKRAAIYDRQKSLAERSLTSRTLKAVRAQNQQSLNTGKFFGNPETLKIDAANCGELARAAAKRALAYGAHAEVWRFVGQDHAFTVIGRPPEKSTVDFKNWKDLWIVDPWANIACKASDYVQAISRKMSKWDNAGKVILEQKPLSPIQPAWIKALKYGEKTRHEAPSASVKNPWQHQAFSLQESPLADTDVIQPLPPLERKSSSPSLKKWISGLFTRKAG